MLCITVLSFGRVVEKRQYAFTAIAILDQSNLEFVVCFLGWYKQNPCNGTFQDITVICQKFQQCYLDYETHTFLGICQVLDKAIWWENSLFMVQIKLASCLSVSWYTWTSGKMNRLSDMGILHSICFSWRLQMLYCIYGDFFNCSEEFS